MPTQKELSELFSSQDKLDAFIGGMLLESFGGGVNVVQDIKQGKDVITGRTQNEQAVFDKVVEDRIAEAEKDGKSLTNKEKKEISNQVEYELNKGYIPAETIEDILGGDTYASFKGELGKFFSSEDYKTYQEAAKGKESIREEYEALGKNGAANLAETARFNDLHAQMKSYNETIKAMREKLSPEAARLSQMRDTMRDGVKKSVEGSRLAESYNEFARKSEKFTVDVNQYTDENARKTVQSIIDSGLGDNTNQFHETVDFLAKMSAARGVTFDLSTNEIINAARSVKAGHMVHGFISADGNITLNRGRNLADGTQDSRATKVTKYDSEAPDDSGASSVTFSNDYATIRNYLKEGASSESTESRNSMSKEGSGTAGLNTPANQMKWRSPEERDPLAALAPVREDIAQAKSGPSLLEQGLTAIANEVKKASTEQKQATLLEQALTAIANKGKTVTAEQDKMPASVQTPAAIDNEGKTAVQENPTPQPEPDVNQAVPSAESMIDRDDFVSRRASQLYEEIRDLKKGVRASQSLGYLLDHGYEWSSIKTALLNIRDNPNQVVNENSQAEATARELLGREYETTVSELNQPGDVTEAIRAKMQAIQGQC